MGGKEQGREGQAPFYIGVKASGIAADFFTDVVFFWVKAQSPELFGNTAAHFPFAPGRAVNGYQFRKKPDQPVPVDHETASFSNQ